MQKKILFLSLLALLVAVPAFAQTTIRCESSDGKYRQCPVAGLGSFTMATQLSDTKCVQGENWGFREGVLWVDRGCRGEFQFTSADTLNTLVLCESIDGKRGHCAADVSGGVRLSRQISNSSCRFGRDWSYDKNGIWVNNGCRAEFAVRSGTALQRAMTLSANMPLIRCESKNNTRNHCNTETQYGVTLVRQVSDNPCVLNRTWGIDDDGIWVTSGCRGEFTPAAQPIMITAFPIPAVPVMISSSPVVKTTTVAVAPSLLCESKNNGREHCRTDTSNGITLLRQISDNPCVRDRTWGVDRDGIWVTEGCRGEFGFGVDRNAVAVLPPAAPARPVFVCESIDGRRSHCPMDTSMGVNLVRQMSDANCVLNSTWGVDASGVWVTDGCRAEFVHGDARLYSSMEIPRSARVLCESVDGKRANCPADTRMGVAVVRQLSDSACRLNSTWGFDANGIWVTAGCRAEFILRR